MPLGPAYDKLLKSRLADMKNVGGRPAGAVTAAQFLQRFVKQDTPWIHLDIAGVALAVGGHGRWRRRARPAGSCVASTGWCAITTKGSVSGAATAQVCPFPGAFEPGKRERPWAKPISTT